MNHFYSKLINKFKLTTLQLLAIVILPLFVFALVVKVQERQENNGSTNKIVSTQNSQQQNYLLKSASQPVSHASKHAENSDSAK